MTWPSRRLHSPLFALRGGWYYGDELRRAVTSQKRRRQTSRQSQSSEKDTSTTWLAMWRIGYDQNERRQETKYMATTTANVTTANSNGDYALGSERLQQTSLNSSWTRPANENIHFPHPIKERYFTESAAYDHVQPRVPPTPYQIQLSLRSGQRP